MTHLNGVQLKKKKHLRFFFKLLVQPISAAKIDIARGAIAPGADIG